MAKKTPSKKSATRKTAKVAKKKVARKKTPATTAKKKRPSKKTTSKKSATKKTAKVAKKKIARKKTPATTRKKDTTHEIIRLQPQSKKFLDRVTASMLRHKCIPLEPLDFEPDSTEDFWEKKATYFLKNKWFRGALFALLLIGLIWLTVWWFLKFSEGEKQGAVRVQFAENAIDLTKEERAKDLKNYQQLQEVVIAYLASETVEERLKYVRHPQKVAPLMAEYYATHLLKGEKFRTFVAFDLIEVERKPFYAVVVELEGTEQHSFIPLEVTKDGTAKIDWEAEVGWQPLPWKDYIRQRPPKALVFRVKVWLDDHYAYEYRDDTVYQCLRLQGEASDEELFAYVHRDGDICKNIIAATQKDLQNDFATMRLKLRAVPGVRAKKSVLVEDYLGDAWLDPK